MYWNYRIIRFQNPNGETYHEVHEVYYGKDHIPHSWSASRNLLAFEKVEDIKGAYENIAKAFEKPVLEVVDGKLLEIKE